jgi:curved DNA-binding protein
VRIPAGVIDGQQLRVPQQGGAGLGGDTPGDLFLQIRIAPHRHFRTDGREIRLDLPVTPWEAALGASVRVPTLGGRVELRVPKGSQTDRQLRLKGRGLPGNPPGDQIVVLKVVVPPADSPEREELYRRMAAAMPLNPRQSLEEGT